MTTTTYTPLTESDHSAQLRKIIHVDMVAFYAPV